MKEYVCQNEHCPLGPFQNPGGRFTKGLTKEQLTLLTGNAEPDKDAYGDGICPNCATPAEEYDPKAEALADTKDQIAKLQARAKELSE